MSLLLGNLFLWNFLFGYKKKVVKSKLYSKQILYLCTKRKFRSLQRAVLCVSLKTCKLSVICYTNLICL